MVPGLEDAISWGGGGGAGPCLGPRHAPRPASQSCTSGDQHLTLAPVSPPGSEGTVTVYQILPEARYPKEGSPASRVAPTVLPGCGATAEPKLSLVGGAGAAYATTMATVPAPPANPSTCDAATFVQWRRSSAVLGHSVCTFRCRSHKPKGIAARTVTLGVHAAVYLNVQH